MGLRVLREFKATETRRHPSDRKATTINALEIRSCASTIRSQIESARKRLSLAIMTFRYPPVR